MTLQLDYPSDEEIIQYARTHGLDEVDVLRDIARLVAVHQMATEKGYLNGDCVLCGGLAMRLYGSPRFTIMDTDVSYRLDDFHEIELVQALTIEGEVEGLDITPADPSYWEQKRKLVTAQPIKFTQTFSDIQTSPALTKFKLTVSRRGLYLPAVWRPLTHDYTPFGIEGVDVPLMAISEQLAEKIIGWAVSGLLKHYLGAAWITYRGLHEKDRFPDLDRNDVIRCLTEKLKVSKEREPNNYATFASWEDFRGPLTAGTAHKAPVNTAPDRGAGLIRYIGQKVTRGDADVLIQQKLVPWLFG